MNNNNDDNLLLSDILYEIAPESKYWSNLVSDLEAIALSNLHSDEQAGNGDALECEINSEQRALLQSILPHLQRVQLIHKRLSHMESQSDMTSELLDSMPTGIIIFHKNNTIYSINRVARSIIKNSDALKIEGDSLKLHGKDFSKLITEYSAVELDADNKNSHFSLEIKGETISFLISPAQQSDGFIVFLTNEKDREYISREALKNIFNISNSEADLCIYLVNGLSLEEMASQRQTSVQTIRTQFKHIYRKTRCNGQVQLVRKILTSLARIMPAQQYVPVAPRPDNPLLHPHNSVLRLQDGRNLSFAMYGNPEGFPLVFCHSLFGSRYEHPAGIAPEAFNIIIPERPGYGLSDCHQNSSYVAWVEDLLQLLDHLKIDSFAVAGLSYGAVYAAAVAARLSDRVTHLSLLSLTPKINSIKDFTHLSLPLKLFSVLSRSMPSVAALLFEREVKRANNDYNKIIERIADAKIDRALLLSDAVFPVIQQNLQACIKEDIKHLSAEVAQHILEWNFELSTISCPVDIWCGENDTYAPLGLVKTTTACIKDKKTHSLTDAAHFFYYEAWESILEQIHSRMHVTNSVI